MSQCPDAQARKRKVVDLDQEQHLVSVLIAHAHPEPTSFNGAMTRRAVNALVQVGRQVIVSDL